MSSTTNNNKNNGFSWDNGFWFYLFALYRLVGLVVKASALGEADPGFNSLLCWDYSRVKSYQWLTNWHSSGYPARRLVLECQRWDWLAQCRYTVTGWDRKFDLQLPSQCDSKYSCLGISVPEIHSHVAGMLRNQPTYFPLLRLMILSQVVLFALCHPPSMIFSFSSSVVLSSFNITSSAKGNTKANCILIRIIIIMSVFLLIRIIIIMSVFLERLSMWNMLNCAEQMQIQKYETHAYKTLKTIIYEHHFVLP